MNCSKSLIWNNKLKFFMLSMIFFLPQLINAQDKIIKTDSTVIEVKIQEINETAIKYKKFNNLDGPIYSVNIKNVLAVEYENGYKEFYNLTKSNQNSTKLPEVTFDSLAFISKYLGIKLNTFTEVDGGIKIIGKISGHKLKKGISVTEVLVGVFTAYIGFAVMGIAGEFSLKNAVITDVGVIKGNALQWVHINSVHDFNKAFFEIAKNKEQYNNVATFKVKKGISSTLAKANIKDISLTSVENSAKEKARNFIISENINDAIHSYSKLVEKDSANSMLLAESAYALALGGIYDAALLRLDKIWSIGANSNIENYYTSQVFALMGYDDLAKEFWKTSETNAAPEWIAAKSEYLLKKYKSTYKTTNISAEKIKSNFKLANELAAKMSYLQSINLFRRVIDLCPDEYLPYVGYSISLEKTGAFEKSIQSIEKAITIVSKNPEEKETLKFLEQRLKTVKNRMSTIPQSTFPGFPVYSNSSFNENLPQMIAYAGGMFGPSITSFNGRIGYYVGRKSNASFDFGTSKTQDQSYTNIGLLIYNRSNSFVSGGGLLLSTLKNDELEEGKSTTLFLKLSVGYSKMNESRTSSTDIFLDVNKGIGTGAYSTWGLSIGKSIYFGKRK